MTDSSVISHNELPGATAFFPSLCMYALKNEREREREREKEKEKEKEKERERENEPEGFYKYTDELCIFFLHFSINGKKIKP